MKKIIGLGTLLFGLLSSTFAMNFTSKIDSKRNNGYCYKFFIENNESTPIKDWKITFDIENSTLKSKRNGNFSCSNTKCKVTGISWNNPIKVGKKFEVGFCANGKDLPKNVKFVGGNNSNISSEGENQTQSSTSNLENTNNTQTSDMQTNTTDTNSVSSSTVEQAQNYEIKQDGFVVDVKTQSDWKNGYCRQIILKNTNTDKKVTYWKVQFGLNQDLSNSWNAKFSKSSDGIYKIYPKDYNKQIQPNSEVSIGFCSNGNLRDKNWKILKVKFYTVSNISDTQQSNTQDNVSDASNSTNIDNTNTDTSNQKSNTQNNLNNNNANNQVDNSNQEVNNSNTTSESQNNNSNFEITIQPEGELVAQYTKNKWATYKASDKILEINPWNIASTDGDAKMYYNSSNGVLTYIQDFYNIKQQNAGGYVLGYPEVYVGNKPWNGNYVDAGSNLPAKIDDLKSLIVEASWKYEHPSDLSCNFAMEGWFTKNKFQKTGVGNGEVEMMVMWYRNIQGAAGGKVGEATIPVEVSGKLENITFDIYKANIGWDFITFIPHNYQDFKNTSIKFDVLDFAKAAEKYVPQIKDLYLEDWEFGTEYGTPSTKQAKLAWQITKYKVTGIEKISNSSTTKQTSNVNSQNTTKTLSPYDFDKFKYALFNSELTYPTSKNIIIDKGQFEGYKSDFFYATPDGVMWFDLKKSADKNEKLRVELREQQNHQNSGWAKDTSNIHYLKATVKLQAIKNSNIPEYTFIQIQNKDYYKPLLRLVVRYSKSGKTNHIWAVIRNTTGYNGKISDRTDLGPVMDDVFDNYDIEVGNNRLKIYRNATLLVDRDIFYWPCKLNYFKAGIYDSGNGKGPFEIKIGFNQFDWGVKTQNTDSQVNNATDNLQTGNTYQVKQSNIQTTKSDNYYNVSKKSLENYDKLIPETYKKQVNNFFNKLTELYPGKNLQDKLYLLLQKVDPLIDKYSNNNNILAILLYIKQKANSLLDSSGNSISDVDYFVKGTEIYKKVDGKNQKINLFGVNWFGFETPNYTVHGLWSRNYKDMLKQIKSLGFNAIRLPFCTKIVDNPTPNGIDYYKNPDLKGLGALDVMKKIVQEANNLGIYVLLDYHRIGCNYIEPMRKTKDFTEQDYINTWKKMAQIFSKYPNVIGADLKNEPHSEGQGDSLYQNGSTWGYNPDTDWNLAAARIGKAVLSVAPHWLIFVEGTQVTNPETDKSYKWGMNAWWGGNLMAVKQYPVDLPADKLLYSSHVYGPDVYEQPYFQESDFPNNMPDIWYHHFGYVKSDLGKPVVFGEFGGKYGEGDPKDKIWQQKLVDWMIKNNYCSFFYWSWNPNSGDTGGILKDDWQSINEGKYENLKRLMDYCSKE